VRFLSTSQLLVLLELSVLQVVPAERERERERERQRENRHQGRVNGNTQKLFVTPDAFHTDLEHARCQR